MIQDIEDRIFDRVIEQATSPVLVEFWQPGCGHCQTLLKELELIQDKFGERLFIFKMNVQENFLIPGELEIHSLPSLALYVNGTFVTFIGGIGRKHDLIKQLTKWIPSAT
jgi:thioredoxin-like negative regulator of GroEL